MSGISKAIINKEGTGSKLTPRETVFKYLSYYPFFLISLILSIGAAVLYIRYTVPKYNATALILVKDALNTQNSGSASKDLVDNAVSGGSSNLQNDMMLLRSRGLMNRVVEKNGFNISYYKTGKIIKADVYQDAPFQLVPQFITDSNAVFSVSVSNITKSGGEVQYGPENNLKAQAFVWNKPLAIEGRKLVLISKGQLSSEETNYEVVWKPVEQASSEISNSFSVGMSSADNTIIELNLIVENLERGKDILNAVANEFIQANIEEKNKIAQNTIHFIDDRLATVSQQLGGVESNLENFRGRSQIISPGEQASQSLTTSNNISKNLADLNIQQQVVDMIRKYVINPAYEGKLVPSTLGITDATLSSLVTKYNDLQLIKEREAPMNTSNSLVLKDLNSQINNIKASILESLQNISKNLQLQSNSLQRQNLQNREFLTSLPAKEKSLQEMKRQQNITEGLYLYLLQKKEETALSLSSTVSSYQQIDPASGYGPVEPNKSTILKFAGLIGLLLPAGFIYLHDLLNDKVTSRKDITEKTSIPITGEIGHIKNLKKNATLELSDRNKQGVEHQFQLMRTNLSVLHKSRVKNVFLVTSSVSGEGKSLISQNLASVLAKSGKKVALLEFDLRKPETKNNSAVNEFKGLSSYLSAQTDDLYGMYHTAEDIPNLHIYSEGPINCDPADLLINDRLSLLFQDLKLQYDYIIINSAPVGIVSDALILGEYSDLVLYVVRQGYTEKKQLTFIEDIARTGKLNNICLVVNDVKNGAKYGNYAYGAYYRN